MNIILDDLPFRESLFPFSQLRSIAHFRPGILTIWEKWSHFFPGKVQIASEMAAGDQENAFLIVPANMLPSNSFLEKIARGESAEILVHAERRVNRPWEFLQYIDWAIREDFELLTSGRKSQPVPDGTHILGEESLFIEPGARVLFATINTEGGPVYIGKNASVMEGSLIRGPVSVGRKSTIKMGTRLYGATSIGEECVIGGEVKHSIINDWSNKAHDGYLGDSILDEWCNLGAGTSNSNLKNNAAEVKVWAADKKTFIPAGLKCGLLMGSYSRSAINTAFNTGTVVGCSCNVFGRSFPPKFIDNFSWGDKVYQLDKAVRDIGSWKQLKGKSLPSGFREKLINIYKK